MVNRYQCLPLYAWFLLLVYCHSALLKFQWMKSIQLYSRSNAQNIPYFSEYPQKMYNSFLYLRFLQMLWNKPREYAEVAIIQQELRIVNACGGT